jgi:hypothetical protein
VYDCDADRLYMRQWIKYTCGIHEGCTAHDDCYDTCNQEYGCSSTWEWENFVCHRHCDDLCVEHYGMSMCAAWAVGDPPFSGSRDFFYLDNPQYGDCR